jgi:hypothetical protein
VITNSEIIYKTTAGYTVTLMLAFLLLLGCMLFLLAGPYYYCSPLALLAFIFLVRKAPLHFTIYADTIDCRYLFKKRSYTIADILHISLINGSKYSIRSLLVTFKDKATLSVSLGNQLKDLPKLLTFFDKQQVTIVKDKYWLNRIQQNTEGEYYLS